jgi:hypothetical protein
MLPIGGHGREGRRTQPPFCVVPHFAWLGASQGNKKATSCLFNIAQRPPTARTMLIHQLESLTLSKNMPQDRDPPE